MLSVVIPCYNEEARLPATVDAIKKYLGARGDRYELILADDGSVDGTQKVIAAAMAGASNVMVQALLLPGLWDTQCGFKLFKGDLARSVFADLRTDGFGYDPEALFLAKKRGARIAEVPVVWRHSAPTKVAAIRHSVDMF